MLAYMRSRDSNYEPALPNIMKEYVQTGKARFVFRDFPLVTILPTTQLVAEATECARKQGGDKGGGAYEQEGGKHFSC